MAEKRTFPRLKKRLLVEFVTGGVPRTGFTHDVSHTGIFVATSFLPKVGDPVSVSLALGDGKHLKLDGKVVRGRRAPASLSYSDPTGFCFQLQGYSADFATYLSSIGHAP